MMIQFSKGVDGCLAKRYFVGIVAFLALAPFASLLLPDNRVIHTNEHSDYINGYLPAREFARDELLNGRFPLWLPSVGCGLPLHATQHAALSYPLLLPLLIPFAANTAIRWSIFLHLALCFCGQYRLSRQFGISAWAASFAAVAAVHSGYLISHLMMGHVNHVFSFALIPWLLSALINHLRDPGQQSAVQLGVIASLLLLCGHPQVPYYAFASCGLWVLGSLLWGVGVRHRLRTVLWGAFGVMLAALLGGIQILPTLELLLNGAGNSDRGTATFATEFSLDGIDLLQLIVPYLRGNPFLGIPDFPSYSFYHEKCGYIGLGTLILMFVAVFRSREAAWEWAALMLIFLSLFISLGTATAMWDVLGRLLPGLHFFRCPGRILCIVDILVPLLAARGLDLVASSAPEQHPHEVAHDSRDYTLISLWILFVSLSHYVVYVTAIACMRFDWREYGTYFHEHLLGRGVCTVFCAVATTAALLLCVYSKRTATVVKQIAVLAVVCGDLGIHNTAGFGLVSPEYATIPSAILAVAPPIRFVEAAEGRTRSGYSRDIRYCKSTRLAIVECRTIIGTNDGGLLPGATAKLFHAVTNNRLTALAISACNYEYNDVENSWKPLPRSCPRCRFVGEGGGIATLQTSLSTLRASDIPKELGDTGGSARILHETPHLIRVAVHARRPGKLVLADITYPGWQCTVDGISVPIDTIHGVFRGVEVDSGRHMIRFEFVSRSFYYGCLLSLSGVLVVLSTLLRLAFSQAWWGGATSAFDVHSRR